MLSKLRWTARWALLSVLVGCSSAPGPGGDNVGEPTATAALVGDYNSETRLPDGHVLSRQATISRRNGMLHVAWRATEGDVFEGVAILDGRTLGVAYFKNPNGSFRGGGIAIYDIVGGRLEGTRLAYASLQSGGGMLRETLRGSPALEGRYEILSNENTFGQSFETGYVEIARNGPHYELRWYTPSDSLVGNGVRLGDKLVVAYAYGFSISAVAYCVDDNVLTGVNAPTSTDVVSITRLWPSSLDPAPASVECDRLVGAATGHS